MKKLLQSLDRLALMLALLVVGIAAGLAPALAGPTTDFAENKRIDWMWRGQTVTLPGTWYFGLLTGACSDSAAGTEVSGGSYARVGVVASLANFAGTQSAGSTTASSGTGATTSNNGVITFAAPTANWGVITHVGVYDASSGGNLWICQALTASKTVNNGDAAPSFPAAAFTFRDDD